MPYLCHYVLACLLVFVACADAAYMVKVTHDGTTRALVWPLKVPPPQPVLKYIYIYIYVYIYMYIYIFIFYYIYIYIYIYIACLLVFVTCADATQVLSLEALVWPLKVPISQNV